MSQKTPQQIPALSQGLLSWTSIRCRLLLLVSLAVIPTLGFALYAHLEHRRMTAIHAEQELLRLVRVVSSDHRQLLEGARQLLGVLARTPAVLKRDAPACSAFFADLLRRDPMYTNLGVIEPGGNVFCSGLPFSEFIDLADRAYFRRVMETRAFVIGEYQVDRITGEATINSGAPVLDETGQVQAVVFTALRLSWINQLMAKVQSPEGARLVVIDRSGVILAHHPDPERWVGRSASGMPVAKIVLARGEGVAKASDREGRTRLYGFTSLHSGPNEPDMYVWIGIPESVVYAESNHMLVLSLTGLGIMGGLAIVAAWVFGDLLILRRVRVLVEGTERLKAGDLESRVQVTGRDELATLAGSFNEMGDRLQATHNRLADQVEELTRRERELSFFREIDLKILAETPTTDILTMAIEMFTVLVKAKTCVLVRLDQTSGDCKLVAVYTPDSEGVRWSVVPMRLSEGEGAFGRAIATRASVPISDIATDSQMARYRDHLLALGVHALLAVPLYTEQAVLAVVGLGYPTAQTFSDAEIRTMEGFANQLAIAWEQTRLREEAKERWRLEEASRHKSEFLANMSHEFRTPLNSIIGFSDILTDPEFGPLTEKQVRFAQNILSSGHHLLSLTNDLLDLSRVKAGKIDLRPEPFECREAIHAALAEIQPQADLKQLELTPQTDEAPSTIIADPVRFKQILLNLLSNAVKFTPDGGRITVTARRGARQEVESTPLHPCDVLEIAVADTGIGMNPDDLPRLFHEFTRLDAAIAQQTKGTGLGLALTKRLVELHGGGDRCRLGRRRTGQHLHGPASYDPESTT